MSCWPWWCPSLGVTAPQRYGEVSLLLQPTFRMLRPTHSKPSGPSFLLPRSPAATPLTSETTGDTGEGGGPQAPPQGSDSELDRWVLGSW